MFSVTNRWALSLFLSALLLTGCGVVAKSTVSTTSPVTVAIAVAVTGPAQATVGTPAQYTASVTGTTNTAVNWTVNTVAGGNSTYGTISASGLYTPPAAVPAQSVITITATSAAATTQTGSLQVTIVSGPVTAAIAVAVAGPAQATIGTPAQYTASVTGTANTAVNWAVNTVASSNSTYGTISASGLYTPPAAVPAQNVITITATSVADSTKSGSLQVAIVSGPVNPPPTPPTSPPGTAPSISSATASYASDGTVLIDVLGSGFLTTSSVEVTGAGLATTYVSATELQATLPSPPTAGAQVALLVANSSTESATYTLWIPASVAAATRLLEQTTFGPTDSTIAHVQAVGLSRFLDEQLATPTTTMPDLPNPLPSWCTNFPAGCNDYNWWSNVMTGPDQLRQRTAFALGQIFAISFDQENANNLPPYVNWLAGDAFGNWSTIMNDVTLSPAMGSFLDMLNSGKPAAGAIANENFARENMQLFNLGLNLLNSDGTLQLDGSGNPIPTYTELQVEAFARVFTGWTYATTDGSVPHFPSGAANFDALMEPNDSMHDTSAKILLNTTLPAGQTAQQDLSAALQDIFNHPNVGPFVCTRLIQHLVKSNPTPQYVGRVAAVFANDGTGVRGNMAAVLKAIFLDPEARAGDAAPVTTDGHLREPILWTANVLRALNAVPKSGVNNNSAYSTMDTFASMLTQTPFRPGSVFNFFPPNYGVPGTSLLGPEFGLETTATTMGRLTVASRIVNNYNGNLTVDLSATGPLGVLAAGSNSALLDELDKLFMHGQMSTQMRTTILNTISPVSNTATRVRIAVYLVITSSQYKVAH